MVRDRVQAAGALPRRRFNGLYFNPMTRVTRRSEVANQISEPDQPAAAAGHQFVLASLIEQGEIDTVLCVMTDIWGRLVGKRVTGHAFYDTFLDPDSRTGELAASLYLFCVDLDMEPLDGFALTSWDKGFHDFHLVPDLMTARVVPWLEKTALVICDAEYEDGAAVEVSPRQMLRRQLARARELGLIVQCASELEFFLFTDSYEDAWDRSYQSLKPLSKYRSDYHIFQTSKHEDLIRRIRNSMDAAGVSISASKGEWGLGQQEINLQHVDALEMADRHAIYKNGVKEMVAQQGWSATFMAKWNPDEIGSSFHLHSSAWEQDGRRSQMTATDDERCRDLSELGQRYLAGVMATARDMAWLNAPFANSYRRYEAGSFAPTTLTWGYDNRTCSFRLVGSGESLHLENRIPGADANPYLVMAASVAGLVYGFENRLEAPAMHRGNAYKAVSLGKLPTSLAEAVSCLRESTVSREAFGEEVWQHLVTLASHEERITAGLRESGPAWELQRYFERV